MPSKVVVMMTHILHRLLCSPVPQLAVPFVEGGDGLAGGKVSLGTVGILDQPPVLPLGSFCCSVFLH